jgi:hypothetical protein
MGWNCYSRGWSRTMSSCRMRFHECGRVYVLYVRLPHGDRFSPGSIGPRKSPRGRLVVGAALSPRPRQVAVFLPPSRKCHVMASARPRCVAHACSLVLQFGTDVRPQGRGRGITFRGALCHRRRRPKGMRRRASSPAPARVSRARGQKLPHEVAKQVRGVSPAAL